MEPLSDTRRDPGYCILLPGGRMYFDKDNNFRFSLVGARMRVMFLRATIGGSVQRLPLRGHLEERLIPRFGADELFLHHGEEA